MISIEQALVELLGSKGLGTLHLSAAPQGLKPPFRIGARAPGGKVMRDLSGKTMMEKARVRIANYADSYNATVAMGEQLVEAMLAAYGQIWVAEAPFVQDITTIGDHLDGFEPSLNLYYREVQFEITF